MSASTLKGETAGLYPRCCSHPPSTDLRFMYINWEHNALTIPRTTSTFRPTQGATQQSVDCESLTPTQGAKQQSVGVKKKEKERKWEAKLHSWGSPTKGSKIRSGPQQRGTKSEVATSPLPSRGPKGGRKCYVTPAF